MNQVITAATLSEFKWKFRDGCLWAATNYSPAGGVEGIRADVLGPLGVNTLPFGPGVSFFNQVDHRAVPEGTVISQAKTDQAHYRVLVKKGGNWSLLLGDREIDYRFRVLVVQMPGVERPAWLDEEPRPNEADLIEAWRHDVVTVADQARDKWGWCGDYQRAMRGMGFDL